MVEYIAKSEFFGISPKNANGCSFLYFLDTPLKHLTETEYEDLRLLLNVAGA